MSDDPRQSDEGTRGTSDVSPRDRRVPERVAASDAVFTALDDARRRHLLYTLDERPEWRLNDLARRIAAWEEDVPEDAVAEEDERRVFASLFHVHVPLLRRHDVVTFDSASERVARGADADRMLAVLDAVGRTLEAEAESGAGDGGQ